MIWIAAALAWEASATTSHEASGYVWTAGLTLSCTEAGPAMDLWTGAPLKRPEITVVVGLQVGRMPVKPPYGHGGTWRLNPDRSGRLGVAALKAKTVDVRFHVAGGKPTWVQMPVGSRGQLEAELRACGVEIEKE